MMTFAHAQKYLETMLALILDASVLSPKKPSVPTHGLLLVPHQTLSEDSDVA